MREESVATALGAPRKRSKAVYRLQSETDGNIRFMKSGE
jgi:hypothetical protein